MDARIEDIRGKGIGETDTSPDVPRRPPGAPRHRRHPLHPDIIVSQGSINDYNETTGALPTEIQTIYTATKAALPNVKIVAVSPLSSAAPTTNVEPSVALRKPWEALGIPYIDMIGADIGFGRVCARRMVEDRVLQPITGQRAPVLPCRVQSNRCGPYSRVRADPERVSLEAGYHCSVSGSPFFGRPRVQTPTKQLRPAPSQSSARPLEHGRTGVFAHNLAPMKKMTAAQKAKRCLVFPQGVMTQVPTLQLKRFEAGRSASTAPRPLSAYSPRGCAASGLCKIPGNPSPLHALDGYALVLGSL
jgi:hypothetical protein